MAPETDDNGTDAASPRQLDRFCAAVLKDPSLQRALCGVEDSWEFVTLVLQTGRQYGFVFTEEDVRTRMRANAHRTVDTRMSSSGLSLDGWLPVSVGWREREFKVHWAYFGERPFREPFSPIPSASPCVTRSTG